MLRTTSTCRLRRSPLSLTRSSAYTTKHAIQVSCKHFSTKQNVTSTSNSEQQAQAQPTTGVLYNGPLTRTFRSLKIFSLSSLGLATTLTPFMFVIDTSLPFVARVALASTAILTSGVSTGLVGWCGAPYVASIRSIGSSEAETTGVQGIQMQTFSLTLRPRYTTVYDTTFLADSRRPFAKWELAENVTLPASAQKSETAEETVAETSDAKGTVVGRWIVTWSADGLSGACRSEGQVQRYFNVHEELLPVSIR